LDGSDLVSNLKQRLGIWLGSVGAMLAVVAAFLTIAPFTPAIVLTVLTMLAAIVAIWFGAWRIGVFGLYWTLVAILAFPNVTPTQLEVALLLAYPFGLVIGGTLFLHYRRSRAARSAAAK